MKKLLFVIILFIQILLFGQSLELNSHQAYYRSTFNPTLREISLVSNLERLVVNIDSQKIVNVKIWSDTEKNEQPLRKL